MLLPFDDYPVHQTSLPIAHSSSGDRNTYDRYFFNGYDADGETFFGAALGIYPNRHVVDASFSVLRDGVQRSVHASARLSAERATAVGPIRIEIIEPLRVLRVIVDAPDLGIDADIVFVARTPAVEEPRFTLHAQSTLVFDYTRLAQWGRWSGSITVDGDTVALDPARHLGCRDRSWGIRPVGEQPGGAPATTLPQFFWLWAPLNFDDRATHFDVNEFADGSRWHQTGLVVPVLDAEAPPAAWSDPGGIDSMRDVDFSIDWEPGTRRARRATISLVTPGAGTHVIALTPIATFQMRGLGYLDPLWGHGLYKGELATGSESWVVADLDPLDVRHLHVQQLVHATWVAPDGIERTGTGVFEQLALNDHAPTGLTGFVDGATS